MSEEFWHHWEKRTRYSMTYGNESTKQLSQSSKLDTQNNQDDTTEWWKNLNSSKSMENIKNVSKRNISAVIIESNVVENLSSESDKESDHLSSDKEINIKKKKFPVQSTNRTSKSNAFLNILDTKSDISLESLESLAKETANFNLSNPMSDKISEKVPENKKNNLNVSSEFNEESNLTTNIVKLKSNTFKKTSQKKTLQKEISKNALTEDVLDNTETKLFSIENSSTSPLNVSTSKTQNKIIFNNNVSNDNEIIHDNEESNVSNHQIFKPKSYLLNTYIQKNIETDGFEDDVVNDKDLNLSKDNSNQEIIHDTKSSPNTSRISAHQSINKINIVHENIKNTAIHENSSSLNISEKQSLDTSIQSQDNERNVSNSSSELRMSPAISKLKSTKKSFIRSSKSANQFEKIFEEDDVSLEKSNAAVLTKDNHTSIEQNKTIAKINQNESLSKINDSQPIQVQDNKENVSNFSSNELPRMNSVIWRSKSREKSFRSSNKSPSKNQIEENDISLEKNNPILLTKDNRTSVGQNKTIAKISQIQESLSNDSQPIQVQDDEENMSNVSSNELPRMSSVISRSKSREKSFSSSNKSLSKNQIEENDISLEKNNPTLLTKDDRTFVEQNKAIVKISQIQKSLSKANDSQPIQDQDDEENMSNVSSNELPRISSVIWRSKSKEKSFRSSNKSPSKNQIEENDISLEKNNPTLLTKDRTFVEQNKAIVKISQIQESLSKANDSQPIQDQDDEENMSNVSSNELPRMSSVISRSKLREKSFRSTNKSPSKNQIKENDISLEKNNPTLLTKDNRTFVGQNKAIAKISQIQESLSKANDSQAIQVQDDEENMNNFSSHELTRMSSGISKPKSRKKSFISSSNKSPNKNKFMKIFKEGDVEKNNVVLTKDNHISVEQKKITERIGQIHRSSSVTKDSQPSLSQLNDRNLKPLQIDEKMKKLKNELEKIKNREMTIIKTNLAINNKQLTSRAIDNVSKKGKKTKLLVNPTKVIDKAFLMNGKVYKVPKLPRPKYWVTDRLYKFLWKSMESKYKLATRVRSEKFVEELAKIVTIIGRRKKYSNYKIELESLMKEMARLEIINTRNDFYNFCQDFLPYEFRVKVVPMLLPGNKNIVPYDSTKLHVPLLNNNE